MATDALTGTAEWLRHPTVYATLLGGYIDTLADTAHRLRLDTDSYGYSERELRAAFREADLDISALWRRRRPEQDGVSPGKIAGMLAYRLSRFKVVYLTDGSAELSRAFLLQDLTALTFVCERILRCKPPNQSLCELAYQLSRRHANQETLALCFDLFIDQCPGL